MPEPGYYDRKSNNPAAGSEGGGGRSKGLSGGKKKQRQKRTQIPGKYAEFRLEDGRYAGEVLGPAFFGPKNRRATEEQRDEPGEGNFPLARIFPREPGQPALPDGSALTGNPRFSRGPAAPRRAPADGDAVVPAAPRSKPAGDSKAGFANLSFGPQKARADEPGSNQREPAPAFTPDDIVDPWERAEFENLAVATQDGEARKAGLVRDYLRDEWFFKNNRMNKEEIIAARKGYRDRIAGENKAIERNQDRMAQIHAEALLDTTALPPREAVQTDAVPVEPTSVLPADSNIGTSSPPSPLTGGGNQGKTGKLHEPNYWLDGADIETTVRAAGPADGPAYLMPGQAKFHDGETDALDRIAGATAMAVSELFEGPYGIAHEDLGSLVNQSREDTLTPVLGSIRAFNEILIEGGTQLGDLAIRTAAAPFIGGIAAVGQAAIESGMTPTWARRLVRDLYVLEGVSTAALAVNPMLLVRHGRLKQARPTRSPDTFIHEERSSRVLDRHIKQLPPGQREVTKRRIEQSYDEGQRAALKEIELRDLSGAEQAANSSSVIRQKLKSLVDFVQRNRSERVSRNKPERVWFGRVSDSRADELRQQLKQDYGIDYDLRGAAHRIDEDNVGHILGGHSTDQLPFRPSDFELIPEIVDTGSLISNTKRSGGNKIPAIVYRKLIGDWYYVVEEVQKKGQVLAVQSAYKTPAPKRKP